MHDVRIWGKYKTVFAQILVHATLSLGTHRMSSSCEVCCHSCYVRGLASTHIIDSDPRDSSGVCCEVEKRSAPRNKSFFFFFIIPSMRPNINKGLLAVQQDSSMFPKNKQRRVHIMRNLSDSKQQCKFLFIFVTWAPFNPQLCSSFTVNICYGKY